MGKKIIQLFGFRDLKLSEFFDLTHLIFVSVLTPSTAQTLGISNSYNKGRALYDKLADIFRRNPTMKQTEKLVGDIAKIRRKMILFKNTLREIVADADGERLENAKAIEYVAHPYLKNVSHDTQSALTANAMEMANGLNLSKLTELGLEEIVNDIATLAAEANEQLLARGEEHAFQKELGNATDTRRELEEQLRFLIYTSIPAHYAEASDDLVNTFKNIIVDINGALNSFSHLTTVGGDYDNVGVDPGDPDTGPASPPNGGTYIDPNA
jgi:hypothetical protein